MENHWITAATVVTGFASVASVIAVAWQLRSLAVQTRASVDALKATAHLHTFLSAVEIDKFFAEHPDLRQKIYGVLPGDSDQAELQRTDAVAEMMLDQFAMASTQVEHLDNVEGWRRFIDHVMQRSPDLRDFYGRTHAWYDTTDFGRLLADSARNAAPSANESDPTATVPDDTTTS